MMRTEHREVVIVGAGPAGLAAARHLSAGGVSPLLLDALPAPGGQFLRRPPGSLPPSLVETPGGRRAAALLRRLLAAGLELERGAVVLGVYPERRVLYRAGGRVRMVEADCLLLACGARERVMPFPGWTLPGVISLGGLQVLMKEGGLLPPEGLVLAGTGPLLYELARQLLARGVRPAAVVDGSGRLAGLPRPEALPALSGKLGQAALQLVALLRGRVRLFSSTRVLAAKPRGGELELTLAGLAPKGAPRVRRRLRVPALAVGDGFVPNLELAQQAGARLEMGAAGGWVVAVDREMATSLEGVFAAGELTGLGGVEKSLLEGELATGGMLARLGRGGLSSRRARALHRRRRRLVALGRWLEARCALPPGWWRALPDETVVCRCEGITLGELRAAVAEGVSSPRALKAHLRLGMGDCQGRTCGPILAGFMAAWRGKAAWPAGVPWPPAPARAPVEPVRLGELAAGL